MRPPHEPCNCTPARLRRLRLIGGILPLRVLRWVCAHSGLDGCHRAQRDWLAYAAAQQAATAHVVAEAERLLREAHEAA